MSIELHTKKDQEPKGEDGQALPVLEYTVDGEKQQTTEQTLTAKKIMTAAGVDPKTHYLVQVFGQNEQVSLKGRAGEPLQITDAMRFLSVSMGPTTVS